MSTFETSDRLGYGFCHRTPQRWEDHQRSPRQQHLIGVTREFGNYCTLVKGFEGRYSHFCLKVIHEQLYSNLVNYIHTISDKVRENGLVMSQVANNMAEQALLGDFNKAVDETIMDSSEAHNNQMMQLLSYPNKEKTFARLVFDLLKVDEWVGADAYDGLYERATYSCKITDFTQACWIIVPIDRWVLFHRILCDRTIFCIPCYFIFAMRFLIVIWKRP